MKAQELSSLAAIVFNLWEFYRSGCRTDTPLYCRTQGRQMFPKDMFFRAGNYIFAGPDSLPFDLNVKAVCLNFGHPKRGARIYFETTLIDWQTVQEKIKEMGFQKKGLELRGRQFFWNGTLVLVTRSRYHFGKVTSPRTVFYTADNLLSVPVEPLVYAADLVWSYNCFVDSAVPKLKLKDNKDDDTPAIPGRAVMEQRQEMRQEMLQLMVQEQRPMMVQQMRTTAVFAHRGRILAMNRPELDNYINRALRANPCLKTGQ